MQINDRNQDEEILFLLQSFGYKEEEMGTYVGLIASSVFAGRAAGR